MGLGDDIKSVLVEVGTAYRVDRLGETGLADEYLSFDLNRQVTKPFIREHFLEAMLPYDTDAVAGDYLTFDDNRAFLVMNLTPEQFANEDVENEAVLYYCNIVSGELRRMVQSRDGSTYRTLQGFTPVATGVRALMTESLYGHDLDADEELGQIGLQNHELYVPAGYGIATHDRWIPASGEQPYKVVTVKTRRFPGVHVAELELDTR